METELRPEFRSLYIPRPFPRWIVAQTVAVPKSLKYAELTLNFIFGPQPASADYAVEGGGWAGLRPGHIYATSTDIVAIPRDLGWIEQRYGEIAMPAGLLFGTADRVLGFEVHGRPMRERIAGLDFEAVEGLGHMPHFVEADRVAAFIERIAERAFAGRA